jgi:IS30 family transposase
MSYNHLNLAERHYIELENKKGTLQSEIAQALNRSQGTISREIRRNKGQRGYRHNQADNKAKVRHKEKAKKVKLTDEIKQPIDHYIEQDWSPEQVAGYLKKEAVISLHHETIYQYILKDKKAGGFLYQHLRHQNKTYRKRYGSAHNRTGIPNRIDIEERPESVNQREHVGHWEADTIIGKAHKGAIFTIDERKSKLRLAFPLASKSAQQVKEAAETLLMPIKETIKSITYDNGKEFCSHEIIAKTLACDTYFAKPYHAWERGQNENAKGLLRQYFSKSMELTDITVKQVFNAVDKLNGRPRKGLNYKTPYEVFEDLTGINMRKSEVYALMT